MAASGESIVFCKEGYVGLASVTESKLILTVDSGGGMVDAVAVVASGILIKWELRVVAVLDTV